MSFALLYLVVDFRQEIKQTTPLLLLLLLLFALVHLVVHFI